MSKSGKVLVIAIAVAVIALTMFLVWNQGERHQTNNNGTDEIQVLSGTADGFKGPVNATVSFKGDKIVDLKISGLDETPEIGGEAIKKLQDEILKVGSTNGVDVVTGATYTSEAVFAAISDALKKIK